MRGQNYLSNGQPVRIKDLLAQRVKSKEAFTNKNSLKKNELSHIPHSSVNFTDSNIGERGKHFTPVNGSFDNAKQN